MLPAASNSAASALDEYSLLARLVDGAMHRIQISAGRLRRAWSAISAPAVVAMRCAIHTRQAAGEHNVHSFSRQTTTGVPANPVLLFALPDEAVYTDPAVLALTGGWIS